MDQEYFVTLGTAACQFSLKQAESNVKNNVTTIFCDSNVKKDYVKSDVDNICYSLRNNLIKDAEGKDFLGVPVNFTCSLPITADNLKNSEICKATTGFDHTFGQKTLFEKLDTNSDGVLSPEEFEKFQK